MARWPSLPGRPVTIGGVTVIAADAAAALRVLQAAGGIMVRQALAAAGNPLASCDYHAAALPYMTEPYLAACSADGEWGRGAAGRPVTRLAFMAALRAALRAAEQAEPARAFAADLAAADRAFSSDSGYAEAMAKAAVALRARAVRRSSADRAAAADSVAGSAADSVAALGLIAPLLHVHLHDRRNCGRSATARYQRYARNERRGCDAAVQGLRARSCPGRAPAGAVHQRGEHLRVLLVPEGHGAGPAAVVPAAGDPAAVDRAGDQRGVRLPCAVRGCGMSRVPGSRLRQAERTEQEVRRVAPGLTSRQLEYWVTKGFVAADGPAVQGRPRSFSDAELAVISVMYRLVSAGIPARLAAQAARRAVDQDRQPHPPGAPAHVRLGDGVYLTIYG